MDELIFCLKAVRKGAPNTFISVPIPYRYSNISHPKHCKKYISFFEDSLKALEKFKEDIDSGQFPRENNSFEIDEEELNLFKDKLSELSQK